LNRIQNDNAWAFVELEGSSKNGVTRTGIFTKMRIHIRLWKVLPKTQKSFIISRTLMISANFCNQSFSKNH
jgi:hypothetical protein